jgi:putative transposase
MDGNGAWANYMFIDRFWRSLKYEEVYLRTYDTVADAKRWIYRYIERYDTIRPHASLVGRTPDKIHSLPPAEGLLKAS